MFLVALRSGIISKDTGLVNIPAGSLLDGLWTPPPAPTPVPPAPPLATLASWEPEGREKQAIDYYTWLLSQSNMSIRGHYVALLLSKRAVKLTISSYDVHPEPQALLSMVVQRFSCRKERGNAGINIQHNALILHRLLMHLRACTHTDAHINLARDRQIKCRTHFA